MRVVVVQIGRVLVIVFERVMPMPVRVLALDGWVVRVRVVTVVVPMRVLVLHGCVPMAMRVTFGHMQPDSQRECARTQPRSNAHAAIADQPRQERTQKWTDCKQGTCSRHANLPLRQ
jgi:hypothetical protein